MVHRYFVVDVRHNERSILKAPLQFNRQKEEQVLTETYEQFASMPTYHNVDNLRLRILLYRASKFPLFKGHDVFMVDGQVQTKQVFIDWMDGVDI